MKMLKNISSILLCCLLLALPVTGYTSPTYQVTEYEMQKLADNSKRLAEINSYLQLNSTESVKTLLKVSEELKQSKVELQTLKLELAKLQENLQTAKSLSQSQQDLLTKTNEFFLQFSKEQKAAQNKLKIERTVWQIVAGAAIYYAVTK